MKKKKKKKKYIIVVMKMVTEDVQTMNVVVRMVFVVQTVNIVELAVNQNTVIVIMILDLVLFR
jgi:hypothetical protein